MPAQAVDALLPGTSTPCPAGGEPLSPREHPKLSLQPRTAPAEGAAPAPADDGAPAAPAEPAKPKFNPFGSAKPVDTQVNGCAVLRCAALRCAAPALANSLPQLRT